ncbi:hypothetical protein ACET3X_003063 [Alternaria dauci]|uniref:FAD dependent oxidoreductase domain-containing protein n=1 Tax=Alternaria dauci TaxID=48095 RepID=A0ABR3UUC6_9PLEO
MPRHIAIAGAGITGLACAYLLSEAGNRITIVARNFYGDNSTEWASPWAGALLAPHPNTGSNDLQLASLNFYRHILRSVPESGVKSVRIIEYYDDRPRTAPVWYRSHMQNFQILPESQLPPGVTLGYSYDGLVVNPNDILPWLTANLRSRGVKFIHQTLSSIQDLRDLTAADVFVNATGLGARDLATDPSVYGVRGQTMFVDCATAGRSSLLDQATLHQGSHYTYCIPRSSNGGIILGGVSQPSNTQPQPDRSLRLDILERVNMMTNGRFDWVDLNKHGEDIVGFRPAREGGLRVEREGDVVHAYGAGGLGYLYAFGVAGRVKELVEESFKAKL